MKKGIDTKIINGNIGVPDRESIGETKWRKSKPHSHIADAMAEFYINMLTQTEDIDYVAVTDLHSLPELTPQFANQLLEHNKLHAHNGLFNQPEHVAFLGHELNSK